MASPYSASIIVNDRADLASHGGSGRRSCRPGGSRADATRVDCSAPRRSLDSRPTRVAQIEAALREPITYLAVGPVFGTAHEGHRLLGRRARLVSTRRALAGAIPVVAIGGITLETASSVLEAGATSVAVIGDLLTATVIRSRTRGSVSAASRATSRIVAKDNRNQALRKSGGRMWLSSLFRTKSIDRLLAEAGATGERTLKRTLGGWSAGGAGHRRDHRRGNLRAHRGRHRGARRTVGDPGVHRRGSRLSVRRPLLRRVRVDDPDRRQRLHLLVRDDGRVRGLDHRLGPGPRIRGRSGDGGHRLERVLQQGARVPRLDIPYQWRHSPLESAGWRPRDHEHPRSGYPGDPVRAAHPGHARIGIREQHHRHHEGRDRPDGDRDRLGVHQPRESHTVHSRGDDLHVRHRV